MSDKLRDGVLVIAIGGTIDSVERTWPKPTGPHKVTMLDVSKVGEYIREIKKDEKNHGFKNMDTNQILFRQNDKFVDSSEFDDVDLSKLAVYISEMKTKNVIVTCGTDYMIPLSNKLKKIFGEETRMVIQVTGSMTPLANGKKRNDSWDVTDGYDNLDFALKNIDQKKLQPGLYISFHGKTYAPDNIMKDFQAAEFLTTDEYYQKYTRPTKFEGFVKFVEKGENLGKHRQLIKFEK